MTSQEINKEADIIRQEAIDILNRQVVNLPEGFANTSMERLVDCITSVALLRIAAAQAEATEIYNQTPK